MQIQASQQIGQRQSLVVTAQLQQAIFLLQMSNTDLQSYIESEAEENPFLEMKLRGSDGERRRELPSLPSAKGGASGDFDFIQMRAEAPEKSLFAHVSAQFDLMFTAPQDRAAAELFLEALEPSGWLGEDLDLLAMKTGMSGDEAEAFLARVQDIEPAGLFARSLSECLRLQAADKGFLTPLFAAILDNLPMLAAADLKGLCRACDCDMDELRDQLRLIRCLNPKPGTSFDADTVNQRAPDLIVTRGEAGWVVDLNRSTLPSVIVNEDKADAVSHAKDSAEYVGERLSVARWLRRAVEHRNQTTLKVGAEIVRRQSEFLEHGPSRIKPMILKDVAEAVGVHESTVSRVTSGLLITTPQGTFPLKTFFSAALSSNDSDEAGSAAAVRHRIQQLIKDEPADRPLSDDTIAKIISDEGINLARRTVAKYREALKIPSSFQRRRNAALALR